ncbi:MAG: VOC family protein [Clostridiales Family XIII bacterium]|jgi:methylmalonyl-CoA/ethylmalonyl-CoA epimerase|nr:VOC family protein [Clostridiales Family XIII bacterium]
MKIHHIGFLVKNIPKAVTEHKALGYAEVGAPCYDEGRDVDIVFMRNGDHLIELVASRGENSVVRALLKKNGAGPYHICYEVEDIPSAEAALNRVGYISLNTPPLHLLPNIENAVGRRGPVSAPALGGRGVLFLMGRNAGMIELVQCGA